MLRDQEIVYIGNDWFADNRTSSHQIARLLARHNRMLYVAELRTLGAEIITTGGTTAIVTGPTQLIGSQVRALDIRAGAAVVLAALAASGRTEVRDIYHLDRGYEHFEEKLQNLGAVIERLTTA